MLVLLLAIFVLSSSPSWAANKTQFLTVAQLDQWLTSVQGQADGKIAKELQNTILSERLDTAQLALWQARLPGRRSQDALAALSDGSILLPPPQLDLLAGPEPDPRAQEDMLSRASAYVLQTLGKLPDLSATRTTEHFEDDPALDRGVQIFTSGTIRNSMVGVGTFAGGVPQVLHGEVAAKPLHFTGETAAQLSYRDGVEMRGAGKMDLASLNQPVESLTTAGEFGPLLSVVLNDAMHNTVEWGYWQQGPRGRVAVFTYKVPENNSTYLVALKHGMRQERLFPAYQGEIVIDPVTGAVLRITLVANSLRSQYIMESAIVIEYGYVQLGGKVDICPARGVAILKTAPSDSGTKTQINDARFTDYHLMDGDVPAPPR